MFSIRLSRKLLSNLYRDFILCTAPETFRTLAYSELCLFWFMQTRSRLFSIIKERILRHYQVIFSVIETYPAPCVTLAYPAPCVTLVYSQPCHIPIRGILRTEAYSKPCETLTRHIQNPAIIRTVYSGIIQPYSDIFKIFVTLAYAETWHIQNPGIFRTLPSLHPDTYSEPCYIYKNR